MPKLDYSPDQVDQMKLLKDAVEGKTGMIALLIPLTAGADEPKTVGTEPSANANIDQKRRLTPSAPTSLAQKFIGLRRQRDKIFGSGLFGEPAWDMLLDLFIAREKRWRPVSISSLCIASAVPQTTALRWIAVMVEQGLLIRDTDPFDGRRVFVRLADETWQKMHNLLSFWDQA